MKRTVKQFMTGLIVLTMLLGTIPMIGSADAPYKLTDSWSPAYLKSHVTFGWVAPPDRIATSDPGFCFDGQSIVDEAHYSEQYGDTRWICLDYNEQVNITSYAFYVSRLTCDYTIQTSDDGINFTDAVVQTSDVGSMTLTGNCNITGRYIKIWIKRLQDSNTWFEFSEIELYTTAALSNVSLVQGAVTSNIKAITGHLLNAPDPISPHHTFTGWYKDSACTQPWNKATDVITQDITLYAGWIFDGVAYKITDSWTPDYLKSHVTFGWVAPPDRKATSDPGFCFDGQTIIDDPHYSEQDSDQSNATVGHERWICLDYNEQVNITSYSFYVSRLTCDYTIQTSNDGINFTDAVVQTSDVGSMTLTGTCNITGRYIRVWIKRLQDSNTWFEFSEIELNGMTVSEMAPTKGGAISSLAANGNGYNVAYTITLDAAETATCIIALYDAAGKLIEAKIVASDSTSASFVTTQTATAAKLFIWQDIATIKPLYAAAKWPIS